MENKLFGVSAAPATTSEPATEIKEKPWTKIIFEPGRLWCLDLNKFQKWINEQGITENDWDFRTSVGPFLLFRREEDAIAFKLKFRF